ncbi:unnamed protein product, partial [Mesorhabditis spiculigera]
MGGAVAVGEQPICGLISPAAMARRTLAETLTNLAFAPITDIRDVKMSGNWMWAAKCDGEAAKLVEACDALCEGLKECGIAIDGGKDSLSMAAKAGGELVKAPGTLVLSAYAPCTDITKVVSPDLKGSANPDGHSVLLYIRMDSGKGHRLGGSALAQCLKQVGGESPDISSFTALVEGFKIIQELLLDGLVLAGHDVSDGGLITAMLEMAFAGNIGLEANVSADSGVNPIDFFFAEEAGILLEVEEHDADSICKRFKLASKELSPIIVGKVHQRYGSDATVQICFNAETVVEQALADLREIWEETSDQLNQLQSNPECIEEEKQGRRDVRQWSYKADFDYSVPKSVLDDQGNQPKIAIIREEGSNGDREMAAAFILAGFATYDVTMTDMINGFQLSDFKGVAFVGGFSYADVLGSAKGWAAGIRYHNSVLAEFEKFRQRTDTFSFGVCNGCQLMALLGWVGEYESQASVFLDENHVGRFHSHWTPVKIPKSRSIMLRGMEGSMLGIWSVHGEGRFTYRNEEVLHGLKKNELVALQYMDPSGEATVKYPWNPNGSLDGVAAICSEDGRHLAMMPHSDRAFMSWQWPDKLKTNVKDDSFSTAPWMKMFLNAYSWCQSK